MKTNRFYFEVHPEAWALPLLIGYDKGDKEFVMIFLCITMVIDFERYGK